MTKLLFVPQRINSGHSRTKNRCSVKCDCKFREVRQEESKHVAFAETASSETCCNAQYLIVEVCISNGLSGQGIDQRRPGPELLCPSQDKRGEVNFRNHDFGKRTREDHMQLLGRRL